VFSESLLAGDSTRYPRERQFMNGIIYIVGLVVIVVAILGFLGLR
jgi:small-conductance mechanosensitive channel